LHLHNLQRGVGVGIDGLVCPIHGVAPGAAGTSSLAASATAAASLLASVHAAGGRAAAAGGIDTA
jgi:hypothetical protein